MLGEPKIRIDELFVEGGRQQAGLGIENKDYSELVGWCR